MEIPQFLESIGVDSKWEGYITKDFIDSIIKESQKKYANDPDFKIKVFEEVGDKVTEQINKNYQASQVQVHPKSPPKKKCNEDICTMCTS